MNDRFRFRIWNRGNNRFVDEEVVLQLKLLDLPEDKHYYIVEQCTGLKDKNGRLIYEGDILEFDLSIPKNGGHHRGIVYWQKQNNLIGWMISSLKHTGSWDIRQIAHPNDWMTWAVVIGNIHENTELLEDK